MSWMDQPVTWGARVWGSVAFFVLVIVFRVMRHWLRNAR